MMNFKEFTDNEGSLFIDIREIAYFYEASNEEKEERGVNTTLCFKNGNCLSVNEKIAYVKDLMKWL